MKSYERVMRAIDFKSVDKVPVRYYYSPVGYYEHGDKLNDLYATLKGDFEPFSRMEIPKPPVSDFDSNGNYHSFKTDEWGVDWEYRIFGIAGIPHKRPIISSEQTESYIPPTIPLCEGEVYEAFFRQVKEFKSKGYPATAHCGSLYERLIALYGDENVLCDIAMNEKGINKLADSIVEYNEALVRRAVRAGVDIIFFGDDYGTERSLIMSPETWREFFKPRLKRLFSSAVDAGLKIHFHSCGKITEILPDLKEIGVDSIWPQLPVYNMEELAALCRSLSLAVEVHTDRANTMTFGTPNQVRELVKHELEVFKMREGGAWFYIEADNGFPFENIEALVQAISEYR